MNYKYQLIILGESSCIKDKILSRIDDKISELKLPKEILKVIEADEVLQEYRGNQPAFGIYIGNKSTDSLHLDIVESLLKDGNMILPIYFNEFTSEIPKALSNQNGICFKDDEIDRVVNTVLEAFELLRTTRKIFISYKRNESTSVAIQLFEALEAHNFDVFLDTHSIAKGDLFQEELWHRMTDSDVIIMLNTPNYLESHWCKEEFAEAGSKQIGLVQLVWPNHQIKNIDISSHISFPMQLKEECFVNNIFDKEYSSKLTDDIVNEIIQKVESIRARNLAARQDNLITEFRNIAVQLNRNITLQPERFLTEDLSCGIRMIYIPTIGIPQSTSCQSAEIRHEIDKHSHISIRVIYDDLRIRDKWLKHLDWLNSNFKKDIRTLGKQKFKSWLEQDQNTIYSSPLVSLSQNEI